MIIYKLVPKTNFAQTLKKYATKRYKIQCYTHSQLYSVIEKQKQTGKSASDKLVAINADYIEWINKNGIIYPYIPNIIIGKNVMFIVDFNYYLSGK